MQVKKFEAPTLQEALESVKRELGPDAIILQTKKNKRGFGLLSSGSIEITAAVSEKALTKKTVAEKVIPEPKRALVDKMPASSQSQVYDSFFENQLKKAASSARDKVELSSRGQAPTSPAAARPTAPRTQQRYADIEDDATSDSGSANRTQVNYARIPGAQVQATQEKLLEERTRETIQNRMAEEMRRMREEIAQLKAANQEMEADTHGTGALARQAGITSPSLQEAFETLVLSGVDKKLAVSLSRKVAFELGESVVNSDQVLDQIALEIVQSVRVRDGLGGTPAGAGSPRLIALVGPTGVGKTTTLAKLAAESLLKHRLRVGLINLDSFKVGAGDQISTYARILNLPFRSCSTPEELANAIRDFGVLDLVLIDTTGRSPKDPQGLAAQSAMLGSVKNLESWLVLSATTRDTELNDMTSRFGVFNPSGIIMSKLDEATLFGAIYNVSQKTRLPYVYFTTGQRVPEDIEEATSERVAGLLMDLS
jgi:flagellar biosynthesis protein FlhF